MSNPLRRFFEKSGRTQQQLALHADVRQATISRWCNGQPIPESKLRAVSEFTGLPVSKLRPDLAKLFAESV